MQEAGETTVSVPSSPSKLFSCKMQSNQILTPGVSIKPQVNSKEAINLAKELFDLKIVEVRELNGYDDRNFHIIDEEKREFVLKIINSFESQKPDYFEAQNLMLCHLMAKGLLVPEPICNKFGNYCEVRNFPSGAHMIRLLRFIPGKTLHSVQATPKIFFEVGKYMGKLDEALKDFHHEVYDKYQSLWMMENTPNVQNFLDVIQDQARRKLVEEVVQQFNERVKPVCSNLESGIIHGDCNEQNILLDEEENCKLLAIIDFGDSQLGRYLFELAITMSYMILEGRDIDVGGYVLAGYRLIRALPDIEFNLLKVCVASRLCQSLVYGAYFSQKDPNNAYILSTSTQGWTILQKLWEIPEPQLLNQWLSIANNFS